MTDKATNDHKKPDAGGYVSDRVFSGIRPIPPDQIMFEALQYIKENSGERTIRTIAAGALARAASKATA